MSALQKTSRGASREASKNVSQKFTQWTQSLTALITGLLITFSQAHDVKIAMVGFLILSLGWLLSALVSAVIYQNKTADLLVAISSLVFLLVSQFFIPNSSVGAAWILLMAWGIFGVISGVVFGFRAEKKSAARRDYLISAGISLGLFVSQILITDPNDSISHVGFFGAYAVILAVHLGITAASPKV